MTWPTTRWPTAAELLDRMRELAGDPRFSAVCKVFDLPSATHEGKTTNYVRIGRGATPNNDRAVLFTGGVHAREWSPPTALANLIEKLLDAHATGTGITIGGGTPGVPGDTTSAAEVVAIIANVDLYVAPMINPDGYEFSHGQGLPASSATRAWRKNRRPAPAASTLTAPCVVADAIGVDINRNFDVIWDFTPIYTHPDAVSASKIPCEGVYIGPSAFSEPETRNMRFLIETEPRYFVDVHMDGNWVLHSWAVDDNRRVVGATPTLDPTKRRDGSLVASHPDYTGATDPIGDAFLTELEDLAGRMADATRRATGTRYTPSEASALYAGTGTCFDFAVNRNTGTTRPLIRAFTLECGDNFIPVFPADFTDDQDEVHAALLTLLRHVASLAPPAVVTAPRGTEESCNCVGGDSPASASSPGLVALLLTVMCAAAAGGLVGAVALGVQWLAHFAGRG